MACPRAQLQCRMGRFSNLPSKGIQFDGCSDLVVMEIDTALHFTAPVKFGEVNTAFYVENALGFAKGEFHECHLAREEKIKTDLGNPCLVVDVDIDFQRTH